MNKFIVIYCTTPSKDVAVKIADHLVPSKLAACVSIIEGLTSIYSWQGKIVKDQECLLIIKTNDKLFDKIRSEILAHHPYEVPEIIALPIQNGHDAYLHWMSENTL